MSDQEILLVKKTWKLLRDIDPVIVGGAFYDKLFADNRSLKKMFPTQMTGQYQKLVDMISIIVARLDRLDELSDDIAQMAIRHREYGVRTGHYDLVGNALLWTLEKALGRSWTTEVQAAWEKCYGSIADIMMGAAGETKTV